MAERAPLQAPAARSFVGACAVACAAATRCL